ncbi:hypothetical protein [Pseudoduganella violaceinigra]|uniref:hypothetical protein n=1 Tax=Pseudoduganella violaceinigra TaxID=246602 RepID=UPI000688AC3B|nr:hypothetical protein [Pseudoduganella violaceinigra]
MGADIHLWVETRVAKSWQFANRYTTDTTDPEAWVEWEEPFCERNYLLFALLANVRNARTKFEPIVPVRGVPTDISEVGARIVREWEFDGHSHSWATAAELLQYSWNDLVALQGFVKVQDAAIWRELQQAPRAWVHEPWGDYSESISWSETKASLCDGFVSEFLPTLPGYGPLDDTRVLFFFDN